MNYFIEKANAHVRLEEGSRVIEQLLLECYVTPGISTKELARRTLLPVPVAAAIKKELVKAGALTQAAGVRCTEAANRSIEQEGGYAGLHMALYRQLMEDNAESGCASEIDELLGELQQLLSLRPQVDVRIDQSHCTPETSLRRAVLCLRQHSLIGKRILCVGDDDLVSVSMGLLLRRLFPSPDHEHRATAIDVVEMDERLVAYIEAVAQRERLPIRCVRHDVREPLPESLHGQYDCFFTDPPYTLQGMTLFVSRGIEALKKHGGLPVFLSFAHKAPDFMLAMQREFVRMGLTVGATMPRFNEYVGAEMIANRSQMFVLKTTERTVPEYTDIFHDALYTGEVKQTLRTYSCKQCRRSVLIGLDADIPTIEELKNRGCPRCGNDTFDFIHKQTIRRD